MALRWVVLVVAAVVIGVVIGTWRAGPHVQTGRLDTTAAGDGTAIVGDHDYLFPGSVAWVGADGAWRDSGMPDCLAPASSTDGVRFAVADVAMDGASWGQVVWVDCRGVPAL